MAIRERCPVKRSTVVGFVVGRGLEFALEIADATSEATSEVGKLLCAKEQHQNSEDEDRLRYPECDQAETQQGQGARSGHVIRRRITPVAADAITSLGNRQLLEARTNLTLVKLIVTARRCRVVRRSAQRRQVGVSSITGRIEEIDDETHAPAWAKTITGVVARSRVSEHTASWA